MKKTIILVALLLVSIVSIAQIKYGVRAGMTLSKYGPIGIYESQERFYSFKPGVHIGTSIDFPFKSSRFSFSTGLYFADKGTKIYGHFPYEGMRVHLLSDEFTFEATESNYSLEVPLLFTYNIQKNKNISIKPQIGFFVAYTLFGKTEGERVFKQNYSNPNTEISYNYLPSDYLIGVGLNTGISFIYKNISFTYSCDLGAETLKSDQSAYHNVSMLTMFFSLGYNF